MKNSEGEIIYIKAAAVKYEDGTIVTDRCHTRCLRRTIAMGYIDEEHENGFVTSEGEFVQRAEAKVIAVEAKQVVNQDKNSRLFSEEIWGRPDSWLGGTGNWRWSQMEVSYVKTV